MTKKYTKEYTEYLGEQLKAMVEYEATDGQFKDTMTIISGTTLLRVSAILSFFYTYAERINNTEHLELCMATIEGILDEYNDSFELNDGTLTLH